MQTNLGRALLGLAAWICATSLAQANGLPDSRPYQSLSDGVRQVAYQSDMSYGEELPGSVQMPDMAMPMDDSMYEPMASCSDQGCGGDCCGGGCCAGHYGGEPYGYDAYCGPVDYGCPPQKGMFYSEAQLMFLRAHVVEESLGKLSEKYEFTPRFILGYETAGGLGARARYWTYGRTTPNLDDTDDALRLEFDVIDVEGTTRIRTDRTDLVLACGFRWVNADIDVDDESVSATMPGLTVAADGRTRICGGCRSEWSGVAGARWSILGADWEGDDDALIEPTYDDNLTVQELYGGVEYLCHWQKCDLYARIVFEVQNWHSDALSDSADTDSIGFVGPGIHCGATF